jgi:hypothetical protein
MSPETKVYPLRHEYELDDGEVESKQLGTYSSREKAQDAIKRYRVLPRFKDRPDSFVIYESILDRDSAWTEGYITSEEALKPLN